MNIPSSLPHDRSLPEMNAQPSLKRSRSGSSKLTLGIILGVVGIFVIVAAVLVGVLVTGNSPATGLVIFALASILGLAGLCAVVIGVVLILVAIIQSGKR